VPEPELVIFDCDGVLVDSEVISNTVLAQQLTAHGLRTTLAEARRCYQGLLLSDVALAAEAQLGRPLPDGWLERYESQRADAFRNELRPVQGAAQVVETILERGIAVCVASQGKLEKTCLSLQLTGLDHLFPCDARFSAESVAHGKPHPDLFLHAASAMGSLPGRCVVVEDTPSGVEAAAAAGMWAIGYAADSDEAALRGAGAEIINRLDELPSLLSADSL
jgi:HAD superfamily hydrolase (TIGR01509 family)